MFKGLFIIIVALSLLSITSFADWDSAGTRGLFPFWMNAGGFYTLLIFVNGHWGTGDVISVRFCDSHGNWCSDTTADMFAIRCGEMLVFTTDEDSSLAGDLYWIPTTAEYGYVLFRPDEGGTNHAYALIYNELTGAGMAIPAYFQDDGF
ncbi:MAG: hypothetical protein JW941_00670 [Candidatus Coatesbacteria bacterium]|nr:hypothetical protein [Candidatus Coatesbacteria bacterium]